MLQKTPIDVINLSSLDSIFLQQAAHLTQGTYYRIPTKASLLMYLNVSTESAVSFLGSLTDCLCPLDAVPSTSIAAFRTSTSIARPRRFPRRLLLSSKCG